MKSYESNFRMLGISLMAHPQVADIYTGWRMSLAPLCSGLGQLTARTQGKVTKMIGRCHSIVRGVSPEVPPQVTDFYMVCWMTLAPLCSGLASREPKHWKTQWKVMKIWSHFRANLEQMLWNNCVFSLKVQFTSVTLELWEGDMQQTM